MPWETALLEREYETEVLRSAMDQVVTTGRGRVLLVEGEAGLGKTRLLRLLREQAIAGGHGVLWARGSMLERSFGYGIVRQLLERPSGRLVGRAAAIASAMHDALGPVAGEEAPGELARLHALYWLVAEAAQEPCVLLVDDLQWTDPESLRFLEYLRLRVEDLPLLIGFTLRTTEPDLPGPATSLLTDPETLALRPRPLGSSAAGDLLVSLLGRPVDPAFAAASLASTAGNPLLLTVLAGSLVRDGVEPTAESSGRVAALAGMAIRDQIARRLEGFAPEVRRVAEAVAVLGPESPVESVAAMLTCPTAAVMDAAEDLAHRGLLEPVAMVTGAGLSFRHPMAAEAVLLLMPERQRQTLRLTCADVLERSGAPPEQVAAHVLTLPSGADARATFRLLRAADHAVEARALESALVYLERCLMEDLAPGDRFAVLRRAGELALHTDLDRAAALLERAVEEPKGRRDAHLWASLGTAYGYLRRPDEAVQAVDEALRLLPPGDGDDRRRWEALQLVAAAVVPGRRDLALSRLERVRALPPADGIGARMLDAVIGLHDMAAANPAGVARARDAVADGLLVARANGEGPLVCAWLTLIAGDDAAGLASLDAAVEQAHEHGSARALAAAKTFRSFARQRAGSLDDAVEDGREALAFALGGRVDLDPGFAAAYLAHALLDIGDTIGAEQALDEARVWSDHTEGPWYYAREAAARLRRVQGRFEEGLRLAEEAASSWTAYGFDNPAIGAWRTEIALSAQRLGDFARARAEAASDVELCRQWQAPSALGRALRVHGLLQGGADGLTSIEESVAVLEGSLARLELARSLSSYGGALRRLGRRAEAREPLARALDLASRCGASGLVDEARAELRAAGFRPRRQRLTGLESLTHSERRVAEQAAAGHPNRAIAQTLYITTKTVELHLTNAYRKLGVSGRHQLDGALALPPSTGPTP
jgi:DNA-binding CsgD family transcriptional regulator